MYTCQHPTTLESLDPGDKRLHLQTVGTKAALLLGTKAPLYLCHAGADVKMLSVTVSDHPRTSSFFFQLWILAESPGSLWPTLTWVARPISPRDADAAHRREPAS
jgi:hypothetical protein